MAAAPVDRTVVTADGGPRMTFRGVLSRESVDPSAWYVAGYRPFLGRDLQDGPPRFAPYNLVTAWEWVTGPDDQAVAPDRVARAFLDDKGAYHPDVLAALDTDHDGQVSEEELVLTGEAEARIRARLESLGVASPRIRGEIRAFPVRHGVVRGDRTAAACESCHAPTSRLNEPVVLAAGAFPGGVVPGVAADTVPVLAGRRVTPQDGTLTLSGDIEHPDAYVLGHHRQLPIDAAGFGLFLFTVAAVGMHGGLRILTQRRRAVRHHGTTRQIYMYGVYERIWHWTMAACILLLLGTGFVIHFPPASGPGAFAAAVATHNLAAAVLILNAALSLFYHVATGEIRQFLPRPAGLVRRIAVQALYYTRGIFTGAAHPTAKSPKRKLNPLQQVTYWGLLNVLFPLQVVTGVLLWIGGTTPAALAPFGGLSIVAPLHQLGSWLFLTFLVAHVYLTTTGHTPTESVRAMVTGWETTDAEVEA